MTEITTEKARIGAPSAQPFINGFTEEGESLSPINTNASKAPLAGEAVKRHSHGGGVGIPDSSRAGRLTSYNLADFKPLTGLEEDWRFTPLKRLRGLHSEVLAGAAPTVTVSGPEQVTVETVARGDKRIGSAGIPEDRVSANAWENFSEATVLTIPAEFEADTEVTVVIEGTSTEAAAQHLVIVAEKFSKAVVVLNHQGSAVVSENIEIVVEDGANLTVVSLQEWNDDAVHASSQQAKIGRDAKFKHVVVSLGGDLVRVTPSTRFTAPGGEAEMFGLYFADAGQHLEQRLFVDHAVANCTSNVLYKGALQGRNAHAVWVGDVLIRKEAEGTDSYEANRNLLLTDGARADSVPNLEIETGLIKGAGHASATGRLDDEHLFYLMARGIPEDVARRLVVRGFLHEIIQQIKVPALEERLTEAVERELAVTNN
ncbi:Fe-S cluster assembly protein SufD [Pseudarthrobacter cellobiosi]|uniref:Fe-S cluster assembly protein SufD n=1 Tax=Pseudarthrobacter cellobiosi TaxID=2953654 RepID=UPI00208DE818|nr:MULTISPECIES: Fe-S cluster assembly protein SufD [unclassified Pseudarthrobacter]MCO4255760.1 Fe-S cluster assembly protein SufD [Pseudarthrobacter sp. HLT1-5]MCO4273962.1 Fe-S cluster assembly protein SufD [Pseudarthrobacter sp. HLT3-5]